VLHKHAAGATLVSYYCTKQPGTEGNELQLLLQLRQQLPAYMLPERLVILAQLPLTPSGKIDRKALAALALTQHRHSHVAPQTELQYQLVELWQKLTGQTDISITDNFFALGGDSISAVKIVRFLREQGYDMNNKLLFSHQTIADLTNHLPQLLTPLTENVTEIQVDGIDMLLAGDGDNDDLTAILKEFSAR
ncbi:MAG TPA: phosphopantetheine-binding protein, partial [Rheinheimera sp.]|nr:phosphopantetheine-binding protein [Rheinheimera sp.]